MKPKNLILSLLALLASIQVFANDYDFVRNNIYYIVTSAENKTVEVTQSDNHSYSGDIVIPPSVTYMGITYTVTKIGDNAFRECTALTSVTIPDGVTSIGGNAFEGCTNLTTVAMPDNIITFNGFFTFGESNNIESVYITNMAIWLQTSFYGGNNPLRSGAKLYLNKVEVKDLVIPEGTTAILTAAFEGCESLTSVTIPSSVTSIDEWAFASCSNLATVTIPNSVTTIDNNAFQGCGSLTDFWCYAEDIPSTGNDLFLNTDIASATLHVPAASIEAYRTTTPWSGFGRIVANIKDLSELSNNKQYLINTRNKMRGTLGVINNHLASNNPSATGPWVCRPVIPDTDNPLITSVNQLASPNTEPTEGSLAAMIDGDAGTFWHSTWSDGDVEAGSHYFQVKMPNQDDIDVAFKVTRRQTEENHITEWGVYGTNSANATKASCTKLAVIETPHPYWGETCISDIFKTGGYKYLRFYINNTSTSHGFGHLAEFQLYPANYDENRDASPFAIIKKNDTYYLYSVRDKAFITSDNDGDENVYPLSKTKMNIYKHDEHFVFDFAQTGYTINVNDNGVVIRDYGTLNDSFDDGNLFTIEEVGDFDPTEALAKFAVPIFTVTYEVVFDGNVVATATEEVAKGSALPPVPASLNNSFVTLTKTGTHPTTVTGNVTVKYTATWNGPFEFTKTLTNAKWYNMHIRSGYYVGKQDTEPYYPTQNVDEGTLATPAYQWAFGGDPYHVKVYNRTTGLNETLTKDGDNAVMRQGNYSWDLLPNSNGFVLRVTGTENSCINQFGSNSGPLQFWTDSRSLTDDGSTFRVVEAINYLINDETKSLSIASEESGCNVKFTHNFNGDWEALYLPFAIDYDAIKADFDLAEIDGVVQNDDNNDGTPDITVLSIMGFKGQTTTPNKPYLIRAKKTGKQTIVFDDVTVYPTAEASIDCSSTSTKYEFTGSYKSLSSTALKNRYIVQDGELVKGASKLSPCRWYMTATARNGAQLNLPNKIRIMPAEDVITGVSPLGETEEGTVIYNLAGQRLQKMQRGINIIGGKKVLR